jgi:hypothetical protein
MEFRQLRDAGLLRRQVGGAAVQHRKRIGRALRKLLRGLRQGGRLHAGEIERAAIDAERRAIVGALTAHLVVEARAQIFAEAGRDVALAAERGGWQRHGTRQPVGVGAGIGQPLLSQTGETVSDDGIVAHRSVARCGARDVTQAVRRGGKGAAPQRQALQLVGRLLDRRVRRRLPRIVAVERRRQQQALTAQLVTACLCPQDRLGELLDALAEPVAAAHVAGRQLRRRRGRDAEDQREHESVPPPPAHRYGLRADLSSHFRPP